MKPNPFSLLKNFTVPVAICFFFLFSLCYFCGRTWGDLLTAWTSPTTRTDAHRATSLPPLRRCGSARCHTTPGGCLRRGRQRHVRRTVRRPAEGQSPNTLDLQGQSHGRGCDVGARRLWLRTRCKERKANLTRARSQGEGRSEVRHAPQPTCDLGGVIRISTPNSFLEHHQAGPFTVDQSPAILAVMFIQRSNEATVRVHCTWKLQKSGDRGVRSPRLAQSESSGIQVECPRSRPTRAPTALGLRRRSLLGPGAVVAPRHRTRPCAPQWTRFYISRCQGLRSNWANSGDLEQAESAQCRRPRHISSPIHGSWPGGSGLCAPHGVSVTIGGPRPRPPARWGRVVSGPSCSINGSVRTTRRNPAVSRKHRYPVSMASLHPRRFGSPELSVANLGTPKGEPNRRPHRTRSRPPSGLALPMRR